MYPLPAVMVNLSETSQEPLRSALLDNAVTVADEFPSVDALLAHWPRPLREVVPASAAVADLRAIAVAILEQSGVPAHLPQIGLWDRLRTFLSRLRD